MRAGSRAAAVSGVEPGVAGGPDDLPPADDELERAGVADGRVSVGAWADHHHDAGGRVGAAGGGLSGSERDRPATGRDWRFSTTCLRRRRAGEGRARVADGRVPVGA